MNNFSERCMINLIDCVRFWWNVWYTYTCIKGLFSRLSVGYIVYQVSSGPAFRVETFRGKIDCLESKDRGTRGRIVSSSRRLLLRAEFWLPVVFS